MDGVFGFLCASSVIRQWVYYSWFDRKPGDLALVGHVTKLNVFPVKSTKEISPQYIHCSSEKGACYEQAQDRQWVIVDKKNSLASITQQVTLNKIQPRFEGPMLVLTSPGYDDVMVDIKEVLRRREIATTDIQGSRIQGLDCGEEVSRWLSEFLGEEGHRLLYSSSDLPRRTYSGDLPRYNPWTTSAKDNDKMAYQGDSPFHLCSEESVADLNEKLHTPLDQPIRVMQFRPNIVVSTTGGPYDEDSWKHVFMGEVRFKAIRLSDRCSLPGVDRTTCTRYKKNEPQRTLRSYRRLVAGLGPMFGIYLVVERPGRIHVGDPIYATKGCNIKYA